MKALLEIPGAHVRVLSSLVELMPPAEYQWVLTGSAGLRLQGVDVSVNDLDLQTDAKNVYLMEKKLSEYMKEAVHLWETEHTLSLHGQAEINGIIVELMGDIKHRSPKGDWENPVDISRARIWVTWRKHEIPVFPLEFEAQAYSKMGRVEKAKFIHEAIRS
jgi:hypothetical protein